MLRWGERRDFLRGDGLRRPSRSRRGDFCREERRRRLPERCVVLPGEVLGEAEVELLSLEEEEDEELDGLLSLSLLYLLGRRDELARESRTRLSGGDEGFGSGKGSRATHMRVERHVAAM